MFSFIRYMIYSGKSYRIHIQETNNTKSWFRTPHLILDQTKVFLQISLEKNPSNYLYIFILSMNFENLTIELYTFIISLMLAKFQENKKSIAMSSNKC